MIYEFRFPDVGEGITEGTVVKLHVKEGGYVKEDQTLFEVETAKAVVEIPSPVTGKIIKIHFKEKDVIKVGSVIFTFETEEKETKTEQKVLASPAIRKLAAELEIDLSKVKGTGKNGIITKEDLLKYKESLKETVIYPPKQKTGIEVPVLKEEKLEEVIEITGVRKEIVRKMNLAKKIPTAVHFDEINVTALSKLREKQKQKAWAQGIHLTFLPFIVKAVCLALKNNMLLNSSISEDESKIILKKYYNIGIAVDTDKGLKVVVIKNADKKSILEIAKEIETLSEKARKHTASISELTGSTFTITNIGSIGGRYGIAIINYPEAAILALGRIYSKLEKIEETIKEELFLPVSLTFDHRILDGANAAKFVNEIAEYLKDPSLMLID